MFIRVIALASLLGTLALTACNKNDAPATPATPATPAATPTPTAAATGEKKALGPGSPTRYAAGDHTKCAVTGEDFVVAASTVQVEHEGKHYAFCCADCKPAFDKDPAKYAQKKN